MLAEAGILAPELALVVGAIVGLVLGLFLPRRRQWLVAVVASVALVTGIVLSLLRQDSAMIAFEGAYAVDTMLSVARVSVMAGTLLTLLLSFATVRRHARETEFYVLLLLAAAGSVALAGANDLLMLGAAYLLASAPLYALAGFAKDAHGTEAALKYYLIGAFLGVLMLVGITVLYGGAGSTSYEQLGTRLPDAPAGVTAVGLVAVLAGLMFKAGGVPGHFWVPDVAQVAPRPVAAFATTIPKVGALVATYRLAAGPVDGIAAAAVIFAILAAATMTLANLAAFFQTDARRLLGYSTVSQVGYLLLAVTVAGDTPVAEVALLFYLAAYTITNIGAFGVAASLPSASSLADYRGLFRRRPGLGIALVVCLLGLIGTPPTAVFFGKLGIFTAALDGGYAWLAALAVANTVASVFYYLRWIAPTFLDQTSTDGGTLAAVDRWATGGTYAAAAGSVLLGVAAGWLAMPG